jgi:hypothetical protein
LSLFSLFSPVFLYPDRGLETTKYDLLNILKLGT